MVSMLPPSLKHQGQNDLVLHWRTHYSVGMHCWCAALEDQPWPSLYLSHKTQQYRIIGQFHSSFLHFKGVAVFHKSIFLLCSNTFMVVSPQILVILTDPFQLSLHPETAIAQSAESPYPLMVPLVGSSDGHFIHIWAWDAGFGGCVHVRVFYIFP